jgi:D-alanyl-D-alanine carboxypeptidase/D-alanyl-D-alanine-endopeptidase (penicillin-binding protein 4)
MSTRHLIRALLLLLAAPLLGCTALTGGHDTRLVQRLDEILERESATGATVHARVIELPKGRELYARNARLPAMPASNMKLFSSAAGFDLLGTDHVFRTYLAYDGRNLWIIGTGDPGLGDNRIARLSNGTTTTVLDAWAAALQQRGISRIEGDLVYYDEAFETRTVHPTWPADDLQYWYGAAVAGLNFNDNCVDVTVFPSTDGAPAGYRVVPPVEGVTIVNQCTSGDKRPPTIDKIPYADVYVLGGGCTKETTLRSKPVNDPPAFLADALRTRLKAAGITIAGTIRGESIPLGGSVPPPAAQVVATHETSMRDVLTCINTNSQNMFAEALHKAAGAEFARRHGRSEAGSWSNGREAVEALLQREHIDATGMNVIDGSGLSRENRVTAQAVTELLRYLYGRSDADFFRASMATPGSESSLGRRLTDLDGRMWVKTGYVGGTRALSGYLHTKHDRWLAFSIIYNRIPGRVGPFEKLQDEAVRLIAEWPEIPAQKEVAQEGLVGGGP